ncbi:MAG TPA: hypothetical protein PKM35_05205 [Holophaga sp.]|nr:hypothetical protein [Holophaga sp.]HPS68417.1 hypothetical protein [Holophaga sp.]
MTRIYTIGLEDRTAPRFAYLVVLVAHRDSSRATRAALAEAGQHGGKWRVTHVAERRTGLAIPRGEILGAAGPFTYDVEEA